MEIPFSVSARTAKLIGLENFSNPEGAIIELVKNAYDADSKYCFVVFDQLEDVPSIYILDFGSGMTADTIINKWMCIGTDDKLYNELSEKGRVKSGAKGIGRFALNRLGKISNMWTYTAKGEGHLWNVDWREFDIPHANVSDIKAHLETISYDQILAKVKSILECFSLADDIVFEHGTLLEISILNDSWEEQQVQKLYDNLQTLIPPFDIPTFSIYLHSTIFPNAYGKVAANINADFDYKVEAHYEGCNNGLLQIDITRNELDVQRLETDYKALFDMPEMQSFPYTLDVFQKKTFHLEKHLSDLKLPNKQKLEFLQKDFGKFTFTFYFAKNSISDTKGEGDVERFPYKPISADRKKWLKQNVGVKIFRDNFRVRPYGEYGNDWLRLGDRYTTNPSGAGQRLGGYYIRRNQIVGAVEISRLDSKKLEDKSSREGLQENDVFDLFKEVLIGIIELFEKDRNHVMYYLSQLYDKNNPKGKTRREAENATRTGFSQENYQKIVAGYNTIKQQLDEKEDELSLLRNLASTGLVITSFSHELRNIRALLLSRSLDMRVALENIIPSKDLELSGINPYENPYNMIEDMTIQDQKIRGWLEFALNSIAQNKRAHTIINLEAYFTTFKNTWASVLNELNIEMIIEPVLDTIFVKMFEIDLDTIFNNLLSNSIYAIKETKRNNNRNISIKCESFEDIIKISFIDTGIGLAKEYETHPYDIFNAFESSKVDENGNKIGTGLGLYITKTTIDKYNGSISLIPNTPIGFGIAVKLNKHK